MKYPFEFNELLLTEDVLDRLGFTEYHDKGGDYGMRTLWIKEDHYVVWEYETTEEDSLHGVVYISHHFGSEDYGQLYFLHELWEQINKNTSQIALFEQLCKKNGMGSYIESYLEYKDIMSKFEGK